MLAYLFTTLGAYLLGSIPTGFLVARARGIDIRTSGSGNIGATNVFRILGKGPGILVLLTDAAKGALAVLCLPPWIAPHAADPIPLAIVAALAAVLGHNFTCWLRFRGGKGIATSAGVLAALVPWPFLIILTTFLLTLLVSRFVSLASILAAAVLPFAVAFVPPGDPRLIALTALLGGLAIIRHIPNIRRLLNRTENRIGSPKNPPPTK
jgi:glycerol-3-phosphate acyltransferase PlsY